MTSVQEVPESRKSIQISLVSILATALAVLVTLLTGDEGVHYARMISFSVAICATLAIGLVQISVYVSELRVLRAGTLIANDVLMHMPRVLEFVRREDVFEIHSNGNATLQWTWTLKSNPETNVSEIAFPVLFTDLPGVGKGPSVVVEVAEVNGIPIDGGGILQVSERRELLTKEAQEQWGNVGSVYYGQLRMPVEFTPGQPLCRIRVTLKFFEVFSGGEDEIYVDVPYIVRDLHVRILHKDRIVRKNVGSAIGAVSARSLMDITDVEESHRQSRSLRHENSGLEWQTTSAKVGYSYKVRIKYEANVAKVQSSDVSSGR